MTSIVAASLILIFSTALVKILTCLSIFQYGLGLKNFAFSLVVFCLSVVLSIYLTDPLVAKSGGWEKLLSMQASQDAWQALALQQEYFSEHIASNADPKVVEKLNSIATSVSNPNLKNLVAFFITELQAAFYLGLLFIIPFVVIDVLIANILMALGVTQLSTFTLALPIKILLFYLLDGWGLLAEKILTT